MPSCPSTLPSCFPSESCIRSDPQSFRRRAEDQNFRAGGWLDEDAAEELDVQVRQRGVARVVDSERQVCQGEKVRFGLEREFEDPLRPVADGDPHIEGVEWIRREDFHHRLGIRAEGGRFVRIWRACRCREGDRSAVDGFQKDCHFNFRWNPMPGELQRVAVLESL